MATEDLPLMNPKTMKPALNPVLVVDGKGLEQVKAYLAEPREFVIDYETNVVPTYYQRKARTLMLGDNNIQFIIDLLAFAGGDENKLWAAQGEYRLQSRFSNRQLRKWWKKEVFDGGLMKGIQEGFDLVDVLPEVLAPVVDVVRPSFESDAFLKIGYFLEFEYVVSKWCLGMRPWHFYDLFVGERKLYNGQVNPLIDGFWSLEDAVGRYFKHRLNKTQQTSFNLRDPLNEDQIEYGALDIRLPFQLKKAQQPKLRQFNLEWSAQINNDAIPAFGDMHINGVWANPIKWQTIITDNKEELKKSLEELDVYMIPIVGRKVMPDPDRVKAAYAAWKAADNSTEELRLSAEIKRTGKKEAELKAQLKLQLEAERERKKERKVQLKAELDEIKHLGNKGYADEVEKFAGQAAINYNSHIQVKAAFKKAFPDLEADPRALPDLDAKTTLIKYMDRPMIAKYVKVKKIEKQLNTYGDRWIHTRTELAPEADKPGFVDPDTGRIHAPFRQMGTETDRPSCTDPNLLNLPKETKFREPFEARDGHMNVTKDCSGQELRILLQFSKEPSWIEAFRNKEDLHSISTAMIQPVKWKAATVHTPTMMKVEGKDGKMEDKMVPACAYYYSSDGKRHKCKCPEHEKMRARFKAVNFGIVYDKQAPSLAIELNITREEAQKILDDWKATFFITQRRLEALRSEAYAKGEARTISGHRRLLQKVSMEQVDKKCAEKYGEKVGCTKWQKEKLAELLIAAVKREGGNVPIQGTGADLMKLAMGCGFDTNGKPYLWHILEPEFGARMENYVYDEFLVETPDEFCDAVGGPKGVGGAVSDAIIRSGAEFIDIVPMESEGAVAKSWTK